MADKWKEDLDKILGKNRNQKITRSNTEHYSDNTVCKIFLVSECPYDYFPNTKYDMGRCEKRHDQYFLQQFKKDKSLIKLKNEKNYLEDTIKKFEKHVNLIDNKLRKTQSKLNNGLKKSDIPDEYQEKYIN